MYYRVHPLTINLAPKVYIDDKRYLQLNEEVRSEMTVKRGRKQ